MEMNRKQFPTEEQKGGSRGDAEGPCREPGENDVLSVLGLVLLREDLGRGQATLWPEGRVTSHRMPESTALGHTHGQRGRHPQPPSRHGPEGGWELPGSGG